MLSLPVTRAITGVDDEETPSDSGHDDYVDPAAAFGRAAGPDKLADDWPTPASQSGGPSNTDAETLSRREQSPDGIPEEERSE